MIKAVVYRQQVKHSFAFSRKSPRTTMMSAKCVFRERHTGKKISKQRYLSIGLCLFWIFETREQNKIICSGCTITEIHDCPCLFRVHINCGPVLPLHLLQWQNSDRKTLIMMVNFDVCWNTFNDDSITEMLEIIFYSLVDW